MVFDNLLLGLFLQLFFNLASEELVRRFVEPLEVAGALQGQILGLEVSLVFERLEFLDRLGGQSVAFDLGLGEQLILQKLVLQKVTIAHSPVNSQLFEFQVVSLWYV